MAETHVTRQLRRQQTPWEVKLWRELRNRKIRNLKFRRQLKIGNYIADFCCLNKKIVVELDGGHHNTDGGKAKDKVKQRYFESQGYTVLRFWNNEVDEHMEGVIAEIIKHS